ncbi:hypothetical protein PMO31116_01194 [Pandoraea morbifera]|uniref:Uncharacterized protein n=1 Tax=Pandoraea morbifera TaxID=2508300 RepID=A0A5E4T4T0_9BURK|nr:hypothetical protein PMO31116_01194 [Pandoraea morbifera]
MRFGQQKSKKQAAMCAPAFFCRYQEGAAPGEGEGLSSGGTASCGVRPGVDYCALPGALSGALVLPLPVLPLFGVFLVL